MTTRPAISLRPRLARGILSIFLISCKAWADPIPPNPPFYTLQALSERLSSGEAGAPVDYSEPAGPPAANAYSLLSIYNLLPMPQSSHAAAVRADVFDPDRSGVGFWSLLAADGQWGNATAGSAISFDPRQAALPAGYLAAALIITQEVADLTSGNLLTNIQVFGVLGSESYGPPCPVPAVREGSAPGVPWASSNRFTLHSEAISSNCVLDNLTGLTWLRMPPMIATNYLAALAICEDLDGSEGRGGYADWRLPTLREIESLVAYGTPANVPFIPHTNVFPNATNHLIRYWSSTPCASTNGLENSFYWYSDYADYKCFVQGSADLLRYLMPVRGLER